MGDRGCLVGALWNKYLKKQASPLQTDSSFHHTYWGFTFFPLVLKVCGAERPIRRTEKTWTPSRLQPKERARQSADHLLVSSAQVIAVGLWRPELQLLRPRFPPTSSSGPWWPMRSKVSPASKCQSFRNICYFKDSSFTRLRKFQWKVRSWNHQIIFLLGGESILKILYQFWLLNTCRKILYDQRGGPYFVVWTWLFKMQWLSRDKKDIPHAVPLLSSSPTSHTQPFGDFFLFLRDFCWCYIQLSRILGLSPLPHPHVFLRVTFKYLSHLHVSYTVAQTKESLYLRSPWKQTMRMASGLCLTLSGCGDARRKGSEFWPA